MASPQKENGHTAIANELLEAIMRCRFSNYQFRILFALIRKTYGWQKKVDWVSNSQFVQLTGIRKGHVSRTLRELKEMNIVTSTGNKNIGINKDYDKWKVTSSGNSVTSSGNKKLPQQELQKKVKKLYKRNTFSNENDSLIGNKKKKLPATKKTMKEYKEPVIDIDGTNDPIQEVKKEKMNSAGLVRAYHAHVRKKLGASIEYPREGFMAVDAIKWMKKQKPPIDPKDATKMKNLIDTFIISKKAQEHGISFSVCFSPKTLGAWMENRL